MMRRKRGNYTLSLWQFAILCVLYTDARVQHTKRAGKPRVYWIYWEGKNYRIYSRTFWSLIEMKLIGSTTFKITKRGKVVVECLSEEEIEALSKVFPLHDLRLDRDGIVRHQGDSIEAMLAEMEEMEIKQ